MKNFQNIAIGSLVVLGVVSFSLICLSLFRYVPGADRLSDIVSIEENGVSFNYPKSVIHRSSGPKVSTSHYATHDFFTTSTEAVFDVSNIGIAIPVAPAPGEGVSLSAIRGDITKEMMDPPPQIEKVIINGHEAEKMVIDSSKIKGNSPEGKNNVVMFIVLKSKYPDSVITLVYTRYEGDSSLDQAWDMILGSLKY